MTDPAVTPDPAPSPSADQALAAIELAAMQSIVPELENAAAVGREILDALTKGGNPAPELSSSLVASLDHVHGAIDELVRATATHVEAAPPPVTVDTVTPTVATDPAPETPAAPAAAPPPAPPAPPATPPAPADTSASSSGDASPAPAPATPALDPDLPVCVRKGARIFSQHKTLEEAQECAASMRATDPTASWSVVTLEEHLST